ncbi:uncharacterized protein BDV14DRAFT_193876 [Aspergillus stella-maris]|uniref:uncharacterized protein n=1 Tax=Aspergillus stella-maris TaxID=1810926 RepID=UPI003CCCAA54
MSCLSSKRQREHEELPTYSEDSVRERKKHRSLPLRSPSKAGQHSKLFESDSQTSLSARSPSTLTPVESSDDEAGFIKPPFGSNPVRQQFPQGPTDIGLDGDTSMDLDISEDPVLIGGTAENSRPPNNSHTALFSVDTQHLNIPRIAVTDPSESPDQTVELNGEGAWWHCQRLPSPVSDIGDSMSDIKCTSDEADMDYELSPTRSIQSPGPMNSSTMEAEAADVREQLSSLDIPDQRNTKVAATLKPPKKLGFSMGYRADCDKCRRRVPGHYSHIIG